MLLITWPARVTQNNNSKVAHAATEVINGITYQTIEIPGDRDPKASMAIFNGVSMGNYYYYLTGNWDMVATDSHGTLKGYNVILDFNGYSINSSATGEGGQFITFACDTLELTDSSVSGGGGINVNDMSQTKTMIASGNLGSCQLNFSGTGKTMIIRGGQNVILYAWGVGGVAENAGTLVVAPYMWRETLVSFGKYDAYCYHSVCDYYTVSDSPLVSGVYNFEYSKQWDLTVGELSKLVVSDDKTYYLWGRNADGEYEYLNIVYRDGEWRNAA